LPEQTNTIHTAGLTCLFFGIKILPPLVKLLWVVFKAIAWLGFYVRFFLIGVEYLFGGYQGVLEWITGFVHAMDEADERRKEEERAERAEKERKERRRTGSGTWEDKDQGKKSKKSRRR
ncbi:hypothetical protein BDQ17DRAFT_1354990, partial [Cyathus striatus]